jgi:RpiB/LacA/LacB family sugar-phosphate isomerase
MPSAFSSFAQPERPGNLRARGIAMRVVLGSDHAAFALKSLLVPFVAELGHEVADVGTCDESPVDYPDIAEALCQAVLDGRADRGILLCGSGVGASVAANKIPGIRAGLCHDTYSAHQGVEHDDANVLVLGARIIGSELARELVKAFLAAKFTNEERHRRRLGKVLAIESRHK